MARLDLVMYLHGCVGCGVLRCTDIPISPTCDTVECVRHGKPMLPWHKALALLEKLQGWEPWMGEPNIE